MTSLSVLNCSTVETADFEDFVYSIMVLVAIIDNESGN
jgi:hypothetical protein